MKDNYIVHGRVNRPRRGARAMTAAVLVDFAGNQGKENDAYEETIFYIYFICSLRRVDFWQ